MSSSSSATTSGYANFLPFHHESLHSTTTSRWLRNVGLRRLLVVIACVACTLYAIFLFGVSYGRMWEKQNIESWQIAMRAHCIDSLNPFDQDSLCDKLFVYDPKVADMIRQPATHVDQAEA